MSENVLTEGHRRRLLLVARLLGGLAVGPAEPAAAAVKGDCRVEGATPATPRVFPHLTRRKLSYPRATVDCDTPHPIQIELKLWGSDPAYDDLLGPKPGTDATITTEPQWKYPDYSDNCNEDSPDRDELYSSARIRISTEGVWSAWSAWDDSSAVSHDCG